MNENPFSIDLQYLYYHKLCADDLCWPTAKSLPIKKDVTNELWVKKGEPSDAKRQDSSVRRQTADLSGLFQPPLLLSQCD